MVSQAVLQAEKLPTHFTLKFFYACVSEGVCVEVALLGKPLPTLKAFKVFYIAVC